MTTLPFEHGITKFFPEDFDKFLIHGAELPNETTRVFICPETHWFFCELTDGDFYILIGRDEFVVDTTDAAIEICQKYFFE